MGLWQFCYLESFGLVMSEILPLHFKYIFSPGTWVLPNKGFTPTGPWKSNLRFPVYYKEILTRVVKVSFCQPHNYCSYSLLPVLLKESIYILENRKWKFLHFHRIFFELVAVLFKMTNADNTIHFILQKLLSISWPSVLLSL